MVFKPRFLESQILEMASHVSSALFTIKVNWLRSTMLAGREGLEDFREILRIMAGLLGDAGKQRPGALGLHHADGFAVHEQEIIALAGFDGGLEQGDAPAGGGIELLEALNRPTGGDELGVDLPAGELFGRFRHDECR